MTMRIDLVQQEAGVRGEVEAYVTERLTSALDRFEDRITRVTVRLRDLNGPRRSDADHECQVQVHVRGVGDPVIVQERGPSAEAAVAVAADVLREVVRREVDRRKRGIGGERPMRNSKPTV
jgi:putative sigma-54 modulation protein